MLPKKNPNADLNKNTRTYFLIGLVVVLLLVWKGVELKTYEKEMNLERMGMLENNEEDIPITEIKFKIPPPPPPQYVPKEIKVIENDEDIEESIIQTTEVDQNTEVPIDNVTILEEFEDSMVPFSIIEDAPIFPGCEKVVKSKRKKCFQDQINKHIRKNFRYPVIAQEMGIQGRVYVNFIISKDGSISDIIMRGPDKNLEKEAARIISKLPTMTPGKQRGEAVRVPFSIPINFKLQ